MVRRMDPIRPRLVWLNTSSLEQRRPAKPHALATAATLDDVERWREVNRWADQLPVTFLGEPHEGALARRAQGSMRVVAFGPPYAGVPSCAINPPPEAARALAALADVERPDGPSFGPSSLHAAMGRYCAAVRVLAPFLPLRTWWPLADADDGIGALALATARPAGAVLALAARDLGPLGAAVSTQLGVDVVMYDVHRSQGIA